MALLSRELDRDHQDPADRFIVATAIDQGLALVTADRALLGGPAETLQAG